MKRIITFSLTLFVLNANAQQCLNTGFCSNVTNEHQYPSGTYSTTSPIWSTVSSYMNADNYTLFNVTQGNIYEWSYCESVGGVSTGWDAQLTLSDNSNGNNLCFSDNGCGTNGDAPYISWTATFTGVVRVLTTTTNCGWNTGAPYNKLVWRMANGVTPQLVLGVDVSSYEGSINWNSVKNAGYKFAFVKATEGVSITDSYFTTNEVNGTAAGLPMGAYHFARPENNTASAEATHFLNVAQQYITACSLPPVLDVEDPPNGPSLQSFFTSSQLSTWITTWCSAVQNATGKTPIIYIGPGNASYLNSSVTAYGLWIDDYNSSPYNPPPNTGVWTNWDFKQYSWFGTVPGINAPGATDMDVFNGDSAAFVAYVGCMTTGITENNSLPDLILYPNPANEKITIDAGNALPGTIMVFNIEGELLLQQNVERSQTEIDITGLPAGMYLVKISAGDGAARVKRFVKE